MIPPETSPAATAILQTLVNAGYIVSVFHNSGSLLGTMAAFTEIHAIDIGIEPPDQYIARAYKHEHADADHAAAILLADMVKVC